MLHFVCSTEYFPLTLTLPPREREQQRSDWCFSDGCLAHSGTGVIERLRTILPLPRGKGRGEGEPQRESECLGCQRANSLYHEPSQAVSQFPLPARSGEIKVRGHLRPAVTA